MATAKESAELALAKETLNVMQDREQAWLRDAQAVADRVKLIVGTLPLGIEAVEDAMCVVESMANAMTNDVLKSMLRNVAATLRRHYEVLKPRLESLRTATETFGELTAGQTIKDYKPKAKETNHGLESFARSGDRS